MGLFPWREPYGQRACGGNLKAEEHTYGTLPQSASAYCQSEPPQPAVSRDLPLKPARLFSALRAAAPSPGASAAMASARRPPRDLPRDRRDVFLRWVQPGAPLRIPGAPVPMAIGAISRQRLRSPANTRQSLRDVVPGCVPPGTPLRPPLERRYRWQLELYRASACQRPRTPASACETPFCAQRRRVRRSALPWNVSTDGDRTPSGSPAVSRLGSVPRQHRPGASWRLRPPRAPSGRL
jgi:hypothetical protein